MKHLSDDLIRSTILVIIFGLWWWMLYGKFQELANLIIIVGGLLLIYPIVWIGRKLLDKKPTLNRAVWVTTFVHYALGGLMGCAIIRAVITHQGWTGWAVPIPAGIGLMLVILTGAATLFTMINLGLKGLGAPFAIALSRKLAVDWLYAWTRNPMVLAALALLVSVGIYFQSSFFILWVLFIFAPPLLFFVKYYEERELEVRFGTSYLEYKARTPMLFPRRPRIVIEEKT